MIKITTDRNAENYIKRKEKSVVVIGASSGMGKAIVEHFARKGANIIASSRRKERLDALAEFLQGSSGWAAG